MTTQGLLAKIRAVKVSSWRSDGGDSAHACALGCTETLGPSDRGTTRWRRLRLRRPLLVLGAAFTVLLLTAASVEAGPQQWAALCRHVVQPRESVYAIARAYGVSPAAIITHNRLPNTGLLRTGQVLAIPDAYASLPPGPTAQRQCSPVTSCTCRAYHTVTAGDSLYRIGVRHGISMWRIAECNRISNLNLIRVGQMLCIPTTW
jgi:LysM repeat protein